MAGAKVARVTVVWNAVAVVSAALLPRAVVRLPVSRSMSLPCCVLDTLLLLGVARRTLDILPLRLLLPSLWFLWLSTPRLLLGLLLLILSVLSLSLLRSLSLLWLSRVLSLLDLLFLLRLSTLLLLLRLLLSLRLSTLRLLLRLYVLGLSSLLLLFRLWSLRVRSLRLLLGFLLFLLREDRNNSSQR
jgi:hypothetical protein